MIFRKTDEEIELERAEAEADAETTEAEVPATEDDTEPTDTSTDESMEDGAEDTSEEDGENPEGDAEVPVTDAPADEVSEDDSEESDTESEEDESGKSADSEGEEAGKSADSDEGAIGKIEESEGETIGKIEESPKKSPSKLVNLLGKFPLKLGRKGKPADGPRENVFKRLKKRFMNWLKGTEERPLPPFCKRARFVRWYRVKFRGYCYLITTMYMKAEDEYRYEYDIIKRRELPRRAVPVTNMKCTYHWDMSIDHRGFSTKNDCGFTAVDAWLYMSCNKLEDAMRINLDKPAPMDMQKLMLMFGVGAAIIIALYYMFVIA